MIDLLSELHLSVMTILADSKAWSTHIQVFGLNSVLNIVHGLSRFALLIV